MAFVFRSPRHLNIQVQQILQQHYPQLDQCPTKTSQPKTKQPIKGFTNKKNSTKQLLGEKEFLLAQDTDKAKKIHEKQNKWDQEINAKNKSQQQYFFKSRTGLSNNFKEISPTEEQKIKQIIKQQIFGRKILCKEDKNIEIFSESKGVKDKSTKTKNQDAVDHKIEVPKQEKDRKLPVLMSKQSKSSNVTLNLLHSKKKANKVYAIPSIPGKCQKFGYVVKQNQISYPKFVPKNRFEGERNDFPGPTDYYIHLTNKVKGVLKFRSQLNADSKKDQDDLYALINDQEALRRHNEKIKQWVKQGKQKKNKQKKHKFISSLKQRSNLSTRDKSVDSDQSGVTTYEDDTTPGPGYYNSASPKQKKDFRSKNQKFSKVFFSRSQRFDDLKQRNSSSLSPSYSYYQKDTTMENQNQTNMSKKGKFFISKLIRNTNLQKPSISPPPGHYDIRASIQNDVISKILKNSPNLFNNSLPRLIDPVNSITPGPGSYSLDIPTFKVESFLPQENPQQQTVKNETKLKSFQKILIQPSPQAKTIHKQLQNSVQSSIQMRAPFMSSSPKCISLHQQGTENPLHTYQPMSPLKCRTNKQNSVPFNSSQSRNNAVQSKYDAEIGLYDVTNLHGWDKKSYNVIFN